MTATTVSSTNNGAAVSDRNGVRSAIVVRWTSVSCISVGVHWILRISSRLSLHTLLIYNCYAKLSLAFRKEGKAAVV